MFHNLKTWFQDCPSYLPENDYRAQFHRAGRYTSADNKALFFIEVAVSVGTLAKPRLLRKVYAQDDPELVKQLGRLLNLPDKFKNDPDTIMDVLIVTPPKKVDVEVRPYRGEDFFFPYSLIMSVHPAGDLYTDYSDE